MLSKRMYVTPMSRQKVSQIEFVMCPVDPEFIEAHYDDVFELVKSAKRKRVPDGFDPDLVISRALQGKAQIWPMMIRGRIAGVMVSSFEEWPEIGKAMIIEGMGGRGILKYIDEIKHAVATYGRQEGASLVQTAGRDWSRPLGMKPVGYVFHMEI